MPDTFASPIPSQPSRVSEVELLARARELLPILREHAAQTERERSVAPAVMQAVFRSGVLRYFVPVRFGGHELEWGVQLGLGRIFAQACGSTSWLACVVGSHSAYVARMHAPAQEEVWSRNPDALIATGSVARDVRIRRVAGGFRVSGRWSFCSGIDHAQWVLTRGVPEGEAAGAQYYFLYPREEARIEDDWHVAGLRGSGSKSVVASEIFVPEHRAMRLVELMSPAPPGGRVNAGYVYNYNFRPFAGSALLGPIVGTAERIVESYVGAIRDPRSALGRHASADDTNLALAITESQAEVGAAALLADSIVARQREHARANRELPRPERIALWRDRTFAARLCLRAAERIMGRLGFAENLGEGELQRQYRDLGAMIQQIGVNWDRNMINCGRATLGQKTDIPYFNAA